MRYAHTNIIARDWQRVARFYETVFACERVPPERDQSGEWLARGTGVPGAALRGVHLRLPGHGARGPTLEIYAYASPIDGPRPEPNRTGLAHLAFEVDDVIDTLARVIDAGGTPQGEVVEREVAGVGVLTFTYARDPEGNVIELQHWQLAGGLVGGSVDDVRTAYDRWAARYDAQANTTRDADARVLRRLLPALDARDVLELGCGTGKNTVALAGRAHSLVCLDFSSEMLGHARARVASVDSVRFVEHDLREALPFPAESFDLVTANLVLEHLPALAPVFTEVARVLRPGGEFIASELHPYRQMDGRQARFDDPATGTTVRVPAFLHPVAEYVRAACEAGLRVADLGEWDDDGEPARFAGAMPRLLTLRAARDGA